MTKKVKRLYEQFNPEAYAITFAISKDKKTFTGKVVIHGSKTGRPNKRITLHQKDLRIDSVKVTKHAKTNEDLKVKRIVCHKAYDEVRIHFDELIYPGNYEIEIEYSGDISDNMDGVYPCYFKKDNVEKKIIATQFESHYARQAFPCIDEPEAKATFKLTLTHDSSEVALSNTLLEKQTKIKDRTITEFSTTPRMSTYLVAFVVGELESRETKSKNGVTIRTFATPDQIKNTEFALKVASDCMDYYEEYYDIPFPLPKCDFVALPDFSSGAMENWGLITFREQALLFDKEHTSKSTKQWVALVVAHELTHQWFGNLVTMQWWTDLWLNEGFASWMEYLAIDSLFPEWHLWTQFVVDEQQLALKLDALEHTHPIEVPVKHPDEIRTIFDAISYQKGASVIHMLHNYLGAANFRDGLRHYLKTHAYKNTVTMDLWQALEDVTKMPVKEFMSAWTFKPGFPLLEVENDTDHLKVSQKRFITNPDSKKRNDDTIWPIPLLSNELSASAMTKRRQNIPFISNKTPIKINEGQTGFYRVNYSHDMQQKQIKKLEAGEFDTIERIGLLSDSLETMKAGYQPVTEYLELLDHYRHESSLPVWDIIIGSIGSIKNVLSKHDKDNELRDSIKPFVRELVLEEQTRLGWDEQPNESHLDTLLRPLILGAAAAADDAATYQKINELYQDKISGKNHVNPDLRGIVYSAIARKGGKKEYETLLKLYKNSNSSDEKLSLTAALTSFTDSEIHQDVLSLVKTDTIRKQDLTYWIAYSFMNRHSRMATWQWLQKNWDWLKSVIGTDLGFSRMPIYAARNFADTEMLKEYEAFFEPKLEPMLERTYQQGLEMIHTNVAWRGRDAEAALQWFKSRLN